MTDKQKKILRKSQQGELDAVVMYQKLADRINNPEIAEQLRKIAQDEGRHASVFRSLTKENLRPRSTQASLICFLLKILGPKRLFRLMAKGEYRATETYEPVVKDFAQVGSVLQDRARI